MSFDDVTNCYSDGEAIERNAERAQSAGALRVKIRRLTPTATIPRYAHDGDSGMDLHADIPGRMVIHAGERAAISTGIAMAIPRGYEGQVRPRSGLARRDGVAAFLGTIDSNYRGDIGVTLQNNGRGHFVVHPGDRVAQLVIAPVVRAELVEDDDLGETERGANGFGSTGVGK